MTVIATLQQTVLNRLISTSTLDKLLQFEAFDAQKAYTVNEMLNDLKKGIWSELATSSPIDIYRRNLQKIYVEELIDFIKPPTQAPGAGIQLGQQPSFSKTNDGLSIVKGHMRSLAAQINASAARTQDGSSKLHLQDLYSRLNDALKADKS